MRAQYYDANITIPGCDKNMPGCLMAMARINRPGLMVYGGTIQPGSLNGRKLDIVSAFEAYGQWLADDITEERPARCPAQCLSRRRCLRRHVHGQHHGVRH